MKDFCNIKLIYNQLHSARVLIILAVLLLSACRSDDEGIIGHQEQKVNGGGASAMSFYLLNEGNMGSNKATLDFYDAATGTYNRNIYGEANPGVVQELGDVGNDLKINGSLLWAVINGSNLVEVMDAQTAIHIGQVSIPNCRYVTFDDGFAYVSSYAGPIQLDPNARLGYVAKIDTATLQVVEMCTVGYQPEQMVVANEKLWVANSGGYRFPNYDRTVSVIDLASFTVEQTIDVAINLHRMAIDSQGFIWVTSRGDYGSTPARLYVIDPASATVCDMLDVPATGMAVSGDSLYCYGAAWTASDKAGYYIVNTRTRELVNDSFLADTLADRIATPYGIALQPNTRDILLTDAGDYVTPGRLYCIAADGTLRWSVRTGDIPAHIAFINTSFNAENQSNDEDSLNYICHVYEYRPAPGQFVNVLPKYEEGDDAQAMADKCLESIGHNAGGLVTLGAWGGYITFGFGRSVENLPDAPDFQIFGNANAGSSEPGIVQVSVDANQNGLPDDEWYELSGSADTDSVGKVFYGYEISYSDNAMGNIPWSDNLGGTGTVPRNSFHQQEYFPLWLTSPISFAGTLLPRNGFDQSGKGSYWVLSALRYGYVDNVANADTIGNSFDLDWAVDPILRTPVHLSHADFIRVYSAQCQVCGWLGETSTEISGAGLIGR